MNRATEVKEAFSNFVEEYDLFMKDTGHTSARDKVLDNLQFEIKGKVLDISTGTGEVALRIAKNKDVTKVIGIDFSEGMIKRARLKGKGDLKIRFEVGDAENLNYADNTFDIVTCCLGVCWFTDREKALGEMKRVCKRSGKIILLEEEGDILAIDKLNKKGEQSDKIAIFSRLEEYTSLPKIKELMNKIGCKLVKQTEKIEVDENHGLVGLVFSK